MEGNLNEVDETDIVILAVLIMIMISTKRLFVEPTETTDRSR